MPKPLLPHDHGQNLAEILTKMPDDACFVDAAEVFTQLSDNTRLRILWLLCHSEECVTNIAASVGMSDPAVSHHLRILKSNGLLVAHREGKEVYYTLAATEKAKLLHQMIDDIFEMNCPNSGIR